MSRPLNNINLNQLILKNIEELEKDKELLERIESKIESRYIEEECNLEVS